MSNRYTFEDLKDEDNLIRFIERVWKAGFLTGNSTTIPYEDAVERFMPDFKEKLSTRD